VASGSLEIIKNNCFRSTIGKILLLPGNEAAERLFRSKKGEEKRLKNNSIERFYGILPSYIKILTIF
jgi:hypothetical protein